MGKYKTVQIGDLIELKKGKKASSTTPIPTNKSSRYIQITDLRDDQKISYTEDEKGTRVCPNDLIIAWDGANAGTVSYGLEGLIGSTLTRLRPTNSTFYTPYAGRFLQSRFRLLRNNCSGATIPHIQADVLKSLKIPLPSLEEQKRIAAMLDKADELRRKRRESIAALDSLAQSLFLDFFDSPESKKCLPEFLHAYFLIHPTAQRYLMQKAKGAIMDGLNMGTIKELPVPEAPMERQQQFKAVSEKIEAQRTKLLTAQRETENLFLSLQQRAFSIFNAPGAVLF